MCPRYVLFKNTLRCIHGEVQRTAENKISRPLAFPRHRSVASLDTPGCNLHRRLNCDKRSVPGRDSLRDLSTHAFDEGRTWQPATSAKCGEKKSKRSWFEFPGFFGSACVCSMLYNCRTEKRFPVKRLYHCAACKLICVSKRSFTPPLECCSMEGAS